MKKIIVCLMMVLIALPAFAEAKYSIKQMTPEVQSALNARRERFSQLRDFKANGVIGETNKGYVEVLVDESGAKELVAAENENRTVIYRTIAQQNGLEGEQGTIEKVFAAVQREKAEAGDKIQTEDGEWTTK